MRPFLIACFAVALSLIVLLGPTAHADDDGPYVDIWLSVDPVSGRINAKSSVQPAGEALVIRPAGTWLNVDELLYDGKEQEKPEKELGMRLSAGKDGIVEMRASGQLPQVDHRFGSAGLSPQGGYLLGQAGWVPEIETAATYRITLEVSSGWRAAITGRVLRDEVDDDGVQRVTAVFENALEPPSVFFGPYDVAVSEVGDLTIRTYFPESLASLSDTYLDAAAGFVARYDAELGTYPYGQFSIVAAPIPVGLGFAGLTYVGSQILPHPYMQGRSLAHEVLHSWLGNAVAVDYAAGNWAEGLTAYLADHALAAETDADIALRGDWLTDLSNLPPEGAHTVRDFRTAGHGQGQAVGYGKTALVFHMLRAELGDAAFDAGLKRFWRDWQFEQAAWADLQAAFEAVSERDLSPFFAQWLDRKDLPALELVETELEGTSVRVTLAQTQAGAVYDMLVPVRVGFADGFEDRQVRLGSREETATFTFEKKPLSVAVDPAFDLARALWPGERATVMAEVFAARSVNLEVATPAYEEAAEIWRARALRQPKGSDEEGPRIVIGTRDDVLATRATAFSTPLDSQVAQSQSAAWVEVDEDGRDWLFLSAPRPDVLAQDFSRLRYYANRSYVVPNAGTTETGVWDVQDSPMSVRFN
ncbi:MAG: M1 family aminopeptidase [Dinoroseobacter sp.]|nr:M1 family aminopeptidase [Dinoroseobacter sp.]